MLARKLWLIVCLWPFLTVHAIESRCLEEHVTGGTVKLTNLTLGGVERRLGLVSLSTACARFLTEVMIILCREVLGIDTADFESASDEITVGKLAGCDPSAPPQSTCADGDGGHLRASVFDISMAVLPTRADIKMHAVSKSVRPEYASAPAYMALEGLFLRKMTAANSTLLQFSEAYGMCPSMATHIDPYAVIANTTEGYIACAEDEFLKAHFDKPELHYQLTGDKEGIKIGSGTEYYEYNCSGPGAAVWYSPACRDKPESCIPVASTSGYGLIAAGLSMQYEALNMPVAVFNFNYSAFVKTVLKHNVLFSYWLPDADFASLDPVQVEFPLPSLHWQQNIAVDFATSSEVRKLSRRGLKADTLECSSDRSTRLWRLFDRFELSTEEMQEQLKMWPVVSNRSLEKALACSWVKTNIRTWVAWLQGDCQPGNYATEYGPICWSCLSGHYCPKGTTEQLMKQYFQCKPGHECPTGSAEEQECEQGKYSAVSGAEKCIECPAGRFTHAVGSTICKACKSWGGSRVVNENKTGCVLNPITISIYTLSALAFLLSFGCFARCLKAHAEDRPDVKESFTGRWILQWVGPHVYKGLQELTLQSILSKSWHKVPLKHRGCKGLLCAHNKRTWVTNASPFKVQVCIFGGHELELNAREFVAVERIRVLQSSGRMKLTVTNEDAPWVPAFAATYSIDFDDCWQLWTPRGKLNEGRAKVWLRREPLPAQDSSCMGDIKLVWLKKRYGSNVLLILWSPPHTLRGVPIDEYEHFIAKVLESKKGWDGRKVSERNMHDACKYIIHSETCPFDASYAELHTYYGPAHIFISHVWAESAQYTQKCVMRLKDLLRTTEETSKFVRASTIHTIQELQESSQDSHIRLWFCTICNNQTRIAEELGQDVSKSPFAQVLHSTSCKTIAVFNPLMALERKWCNYEFCVGISMSKQILMTTQEGVIQAGQIAPKTLHNISEKVVNFHCQNATCTSKADEELIDFAVAKMGGYGVLDGSLKEAFQEAILEAQDWVEQALDHFAGGEEAPVIVRL